jgi:hypothetical protein
MNRITFMPRYTRHKNKGYKKARKIFPGFLFKPLYAARVLEHLVPRTRICLFCLFRLNLTQPSPAIACAIYSLSIHSSPYNRNHLRALSATIGSYLRSTALSAVEGLFDIPVYPGLFAVLTNQQRYAFLMANQKVEMRGIEPRSNERLTTN